MFGESGSVDGVSMVSPSYAEKYAGNGDEGRKRPTPDSGPSAALPTWEHIEETLPAKPRLAGGILGS